ncbi:sst-20 [Pristionchus pacificus]|uniref:Sst-20 n=1 Tax=Pristionchus pacificus TaxID=54126 RepID=A0A2A6CGH0_PRIPA|nr:sst-20 [Pristionchus pacificus]|eukprot:PDM77229.1 sst-20 [Pristionchus pacificus]
MSLVTARLTEVIKSSPPLLSVLVYVEFYIAFMICLFSIVGFSMGENTLTVLLMAGLQTVIAMPGYLYMMWNEPKYLLVFALVQVAAFCTEFLWAIVLLFGHGFDGRSGLLMSLSILQLTNVIVAFFFRDLRVDFCCCGKNRRARGQNSVSLENGLTPPPANWAKTSSPNRYCTETNRAPSRSTSEKVAEEKKARKSTIKNALRRKKNVGFEVEENPSKNGTAHSPLEKNIFGGISEEEKERAIQKRLSRLPAHTPSRSMTKSPGEVRVEPGSSSTSSRRVAPKKASSVPQKAARPMTGSGSRSKERTPSKEGSGSRERTSSESLVS